MQSLKLLIEVTFLIFSGKEFQSTAHLLSMQRDPKLVENLLIWTSSLVLVL